ncbi:MAG: hypothetical protein Q8Q92_03285, partial [bacterium]|nr:hypothetical protein [bacterium]
MKKQTLLKYLPAFTLIELLIYTTVFAIAGGLLTTILVTTTRIQNVEIVNTQVGQELSLVLSTVQRLVRDASLIECAGPDQANCSLSNSGLLLRLRFEDTTKDPTCVYLDTNIIKLAGPDATNKYCNLATATNLTTNKVIANSLTFTKFDIPGGHATVQIDANLSYNSPSPQLQISKTLRSAVGRVSAATFDSNLIPDADNSRSIGQIGPDRKWRNLFMSNLLGLGTFTDATEPISTTAGTLYFNTTGNNVKVYNGTSWLAVGSQTPWTQNISAAGFTLSGNSTASGVLTLDSTSHATKGNIILNPTGGNVGVGTASPGSAFDLNGATSLRGITAAAAGLSPATQGRIYFDSGTNKFQVSQNGGAYVDLVAGGSSGSSLIKSFTAYESISAFEPVRVATGNAYYYNDAPSSCCGGLKVYGSGGIQERAAVKFDIPAGGGKVDKVIFVNSLARLGVPSDNLRVQI